MADYQQRRERVRRRLRDEQCAGLLVTHVPNVRYLTGFTGDDSFLLLTRDVAVMLSDARYEEQIASECPGLDAQIRRAPTTMSDLLARTVRSVRVQQLAVEAESVTLAMAEQWADALPQVTFAPAAGWVARLREIKDREEVATIRRAIDLAQRAFAVIRAGLRPEQTERDVAFALEHQIRLFGGEGCSFPPIVAAGPRAALPHARPTAAALGGHELLLFDWGAVVDGYRSDLTRVLAVAKIPPKLERVYRVVLKAQQQAIASLRPGALLSDVDAAARQVIAAAGYGKRFGHGLGHGIGLEIHEQPRLAPKQDRPLAAGMVVTVEPGIYLPGWGGVRIEDDVLVTRTGHEVLSSTARELSDCLIGWPG